MTLTDYARRSIPRHGGIFNFGRCLFNVDPFNKDGGPNITSNIDVHYIFHKEYNWCHNCGMYRIDLRSNAMCENCRNKDEKSAEDLHDQMSEEFDRVMAIRRRYVPVHMIELIRGKEIEGPIDDRMEEVKTMIQDLPQPETVITTSFRDMLQQRFGDEDSTQETSNE